MVNNLVSSGLGLAEDIDILQWAKRHRKIQIKGQYKPFRLNRDGFEYPFLGDIYTELSLGNDTVIMKPTQIGATEVALNSALFFLDKKAENVMYLLPTKSQSRDFSHNRVDGAIDNSEYVERMFSDISNVGNKQTSSGNALYLRGTNSSSGLEEVPVGFLIRDEIEKMDKENADLALKRLGASQYKWRLDLSHPTYPGGAIDEAYNNSSRGRWQITCPECGEKQHLDWEDNVISRPRERLGCKHCKAEWNKDDLWSGEWVHREPESPTKGFKFTQLLSPTVTIEEIKEEYYTAQSLGGYKLEQFYNTVLAEPWVAQGNSLTRDTIEKLKVDGVNTNPSKAVMGVDVGNMLHYWIQSDDTVIKLGKTESFDRLKKPISEYNVKKVVIDAMPETRAAREFIESISIQGWLCRRSANLESSKLVKDEEIKVNAVEHYDKFVSQFNNGDIIIPMDIPEEAVNHLIAPVRVIEDNKARWEKGVNHYADAGAYAYEALQIKGSEPRIRSLT